MNVNNIEIYSILFLLCFSGGDFVKYTFPLAFTVTLMSWGVVKYSDAYDAAKQLPFALDGIKWGIDYLIACHLQA